jgi:hypothetical protein
MSAFTLTAANVQKGANAQTKTVIAGEAVTAGQPLWKDPANSNKYYKARANAAGTYAAGGIALANAAAGQPVVIDIKDDDFTPGFTSTIGETLMVGADAAGDVAPIGDKASGTYVYVFGVMKSTTKAVIDFTSPLDAGAVIPA